MVKSNESSQQNQISSLFSRIKSLYNMMGLEKEDRMSLIVTFILLAVWFITLTLFDLQLLGIVTLWSGMITLSIVYYFIYSRKKRNMKILKYRFLGSTVLIYPVLFYYVFILLERGVIVGSFRFLPFFIIFSMLLINSLIIYYFKIIKKN